MFKEKISIPVHQSIIVCRITSNIAVLPFMRLRLKPGDSNGLLVESDVMADKILTLRKSDLAKKLGNISEDELLLFWIEL